MDEKQLREQAEESEFKVALLHLPEPDKACPDCQPSQSELEAMRRKLRRASHRGYSNRFRKYRLAAILVIATLFLAVGVYALPNILNYFVARYESYVSISRTPENSQPQYLSVDMLQMPKYIPPGFISSDPIPYENFIYIQFTNSCGELIGYCYYPYGEANLDAENAVKVEKMHINRQDGLLVETSDKVILTWGIEPAYLFKSSSVSAGELIKMAESIGQ